MGILAHGPEEKRGFAGRTAGVSIVMICIILTDIRLSLGRGVPLGGIRSPGKNVNMQRRLRNGTGSAPREVGEKSCNKRRRPAQNRHRHLRECSRSGRPCWWRRCARPTASTESPETGMIEAETRRAVGVGVAATVTVTVTTGLSGNVTTFQIFLKIVCNRYGRRTSLSLSPVLPRHSQEQR